MSLISPGIEVKEFDLTTVIPSVASTEGAIAGCFAWGPVETATLITSEVDLVNRFGKPITGWNTETFFVAADFLSYADALYVSRASDGVKSLVTLKDALNVDVPIFEAIYPGTMGDSIEVHVMDAVGYYDPTNRYGAAVYDTAGKMSKQTFIGTVPAVGEYHVVVVDKLGAFSGVAGSILEVFESVSSDSSAKMEDGTTKYIFSAINTKSNYIKITEDEGQLGYVSPITLFAGYQVLDLVGGSNGSDEATISMSALQDAYSVFQSKEDIDISLIMAGKARGLQPTEMANWISDNIIDIRKDCMLFVSPNKEAVVATNIDKLTNVIVFKTGRGPGSTTTIGTPLTESSYTVMDSGYKYRYDRYNDKYVWVPLNGDIAGLCARTDDLRDPWWSPAGYNRGNIKNVVKLAWSPKQAERDTLYQNNVNPVLTQVGHGTLLFGDKTAMNRPSAFDRINVRRLFIVLEKAVARAARNFLFEFNDEFTRAQFVNIVEPYLRDIQGRRGIYDYRVVCDETNNTAEIIDKNKFVGDIYIKPARSINFITLNFVAVRTGVEFSEIVGKF